MIATTRIGYGLLATGMVVAAAACGAAQDPTDKASSATSASAASATSQPPEESFSPLFEQALPNVAGKTFTSAIVDFPPAARAVPHRHGDAFVYAYVLQGSMRSKQDGDEPRTYHQGENWIELPGAHHVLTENSSRTDPAKLLVVFVADTGDPLKTDDQPK
ncbi:cupin domain-containing protein [Nocardia sp. NPDC049190]|uniref:cupin domain-containing protein n=1 Tax=Nocardia sp. NPDC049190 TaxID=3155650 RepID=UPI0033CDC32C